jgi:DNA-binding response OmpR family regulator
VFPSEKRVLVVDDERAVRTMLEYGLSRAGFAVRSTVDGRTALESVREWNPEVVVLDVMLPETDGFSLLPHFREITDAPIILLSARTETADKVLGLQRGADDYVPKPFEMEELVARIQSALRRPRLDVRHTLTHADLVVDVTRQQVRRGERRVELSKREFALLITLLRYPGKIFSRAELLDTVWGIERSVAPNVVETYVSYLRAKVDHGEPVKLIQTVRGSGYVLSSEEV